MNLTTSPFKRLREATGLTKAEFYKRAGVSESTLTFIEAGLYSVNPVRAEDELLKACLLRDVPVTAILAEYGGGTIHLATLAWHRAVRAALSGQVAEAFAAARAHPNEDISPIEDFAQRLAGSKTGFCKMLKFQVAAFYQFDTGITRTFPKAMYAAFIDAGLSQRQIDELELEQQHWLREHKQPEVELVD